MSFENSICNATPAFNPNRTTSNQTVASSPSRSTDSNHSTQTKKKNKRSKKGYSKKSLQKEIILQTRRKKKVGNDTHMIRSVNVKKKVKVKKKIKKTQADNEIKTERKFWNTVEKMDLKTSLQTCQTIVIGIGYDLFHCKVAKIANNHVHLCLKERYYSSVKDFDQYTLKTFKIMMEQGVYLTHLFQRRAANTSRSKRFVYKD